MHVAALLARRRRPRAGGARRRTSTAASCCCATSATAPTSPRSTTRSRRRSTRRDRRADPLAARVRDGALPPYDEALLRARTRPLSRLVRGAPPRRRARPPAQRRCSPTRSRACSPTTSAQPRVFVHRDYHSRNLMVARPNPGVLDFQDAVYGPITYDLVLAAARRVRRVGRGSGSSTGPSATGSARARPGCRSAPTSPRSGATSNGWACSGSSRCWASSRASCHRDGKAGYLADMPRVMALPARRVRALPRARRRCSRLARRARGAARAADGLHVLMADERHGAMILAAGRGERMRPLSDATPKPLLEVGGKPLIVWQIEALARAGFTATSSINAAHLADALVARLGDGRALGVRSPGRSRAGGAGDRRRHRDRAAAAAAGPGADRQRRHLDATSTTRACCRGPPRWRAIPRRRACTSSWSPNPPYHPAGDFALRPRPAAPGAARRARRARARLTFGNIGALRHRAVRRTSPRDKLKLLPLFRDWIARGIVSGERYDGHWANVGTPDELARLDALLRARPRSGLPNPHSTTPPMTPNPLLDFSGLPRFDAIDAEHVAPAVDALLATRARPSRARGDRRRPADLGQRRRAARRRPRPLRPRVGRGAPPQRRRQHARRCATPTTATCRRSPRSTPTSGRTSACSRAISALAASPAFAALAAAQQKAIDNELRDFRLGGAELPAERQGAVQGESQEELAGLSAKFDDNVLDATNAWSLVVERRGRARRHARPTCSPRRAGRGRSRRQAGLEAHAAHALLPAGDAVRRQPRAARDAAPRLRHPRLGAGREPELGQHAGDRAASWRCAARPRSCSATPTTPRCRWCRRWRETPGEVLAFLRDLGNAREALRRARLRRARRVRPRRAGARRARPLGPRLRVGEAARRSATPSPSRRSASTSPRTACSPACSASSRRSTACRSREATRADLAPEPCASSTSVDRDGALVGQFYLDLYARENKQGGAWMDDAINRRRRRCARPAPGRVPDLQPVGAGRRQARDVHARRGHHDLPRVRARPAPPADAGRRRRACRASRASSGTRSSCPASSWRTSAGSGTSCCR